MKTINHILSRFVLVMFIALLLGSCKDDEIAELKLSRQFKPSAFTLTSGETSATIRWSSSLFTDPEETEYKLELSKTNTFATIEKSVTTGDVEVTFLDTELEIRIDYYARVRALGKNGTADSNWLISNAFRITGEIFILPVPEHQVLTEAAVINWIPGKDIVKVVLTPQGGTPVEFVVSSAEADAGEKMVEGLIPGTTYTAEIFSSDGVSKGFANFKTKPSYAGTTVIDLREITGRPKVLLDTLPQIPDGSVVLLKRGQVYTMDSDDGTNRNFSKSVTITSGDDLIPEFATIHTVTNFNFVANSIIDSIVFRDLNIKGIRPGGASYDNDYIINGNVVATIGTIRLDNCKISRLRGVVRVQTGGAGAHIDNYIVNNCAVDSIREFAVVMASGGSSFKNVRIINSTFYRLRKFIDHRVPGNISMVIQNCTFNEMPRGGPEGGGGDYVIDFNTANSDNPIAITNCIFGKSWDEGLGNDTRGVRVGGTTNIVVTNSYALSDFVNTNATFQIPGITPYAGTSTAVFTNSAAGNFLIKDNSFPGRTSAGDPRWRQ